MNLPAKIIVESVIIPSLLPPADFPPGHVDSHHVPNLTPSFSSPQMSADISSLCQWPSEISDAMEWSVRFLDYPHFQ